MDGANIGGGAPMSGKVPRIATINGQLSIQNHRYSGAILHSFCIFDRNKSKKDGFYIAIRSTIPCLVPLPSPCQNRPKSAGGSSRKTAVNQYKSHLMTGIPPQQRARLSLPFPNRQDAASDFCPYSSEETMSLPPRNHDAAPPPEGSADLNHD